MKNVNKIGFTIIILFFALNLLGQSSAEKLRKEQERLEKNISNTKSLLFQTKSNSEATLNELKLIDNQVQYREELLQNFDNQIRSTELKIEQKNQQINDLEVKIIALKEQYRKLLIYAYKKRSKEGKMMYIFSSNTYYQALKRKKYLEKIAEIQRKQKLIIQQHRKLISREKGELIEEKSYKEKIADEKRKEKNEILKDKVKQANTLDNLRKEEQNLLASIKKDEQKKAELKRKIDRAIQQEIAKADERAKREREKAKTPKGTTKPTKTSETTEKPIVEEKETKETAEVRFVEPKEVALNSNFESNKGKLPWPVTTGSITEKFGKNPHPSIPNIFTNNNGVDISTNKGAQVRAVFEGEVTSVISILGAGKTVIVKHGNYRTVYSNLQDVYVSMGTKISTKQAIGSLLSGDDSNLSTLHFEVRHDINVMNPSLWISR